MRRLTILAAALAITSTLLAPIPTRAAFPGANGRIVFVIGDEFGIGHNIVTMASNGSDIDIILTAGSGESLAGPAWSPGGYFILYSSQVAGNTDIWRMNADGTGRQRLTSHAGFDGQPDWSADGSRIVFASNRSGNLDIYTMSVDGGDLRRLTTNPAADGDPAWSPDNDRIAFSSNRRVSPQAKEIYLMAADGTQVERITTATVDNFEWDEHEDPEWSPDGTKVAFTFAHFDTTTRIWETTLGTDTHQLMLTPTNGYHHSPRYAPDSTSPVADAILFTVRYFTGDGGPGDGDLYVNSTSGGSPIQLTDTEDQSEVTPDWQPIPDFPLVDARFSTFRPDIEWVYDAGITVGCSVERYCPDISVTREQMASFLVRALGLTGTPPDAFTDDETSIHEHNINLLAAAGVTTGCGPGLFCPKQVVKRDQVASFLARALDLPATATDYFTDDENNTHEVDINRLRSAGITSGCTATTYCPAGVVTRGQMAAFLHRGFD